MQALQNFQITGGRHHRADVRAPNNFLLQLLVVGPWLTTCADLRVNRLAWYEFFRKANQRRWSRSDFGGNRDQRQHYQQLISLSIRNTGGQVNGSVSARGT